MKRMQFSLAIAGILLLGAAVLHGTLSTPSNVASVTTPSGGSGGGAGAAEWYGPFSSWDNVKAKYGAKGDGVTDDTSAINNALANVGLNGNSPVLYFPAGTYRVTQGLLLKYRVGIEIWGADPDATKILWDGGSGGTLLRVNGLVDSAISRLTFDGNNKNGMVMDFNFDGVDNSYFDGGSSIVDCQFKNGSYGVRGGASGVGFANNTFRRCRFINLTYGVTTHNANAFQIYLIDCFVANCQRGVWTPMGGVNAYRTSFKNNEWDVHWPYSFSFGSLVSNVSYHSGGFLYMGESTPFLVKGNTIIDPTNAAPIYVNQAGPLMLLDNTVMQNSPSGSPVRMGSGLAADLLAVGNKFTTGNWFASLGGSGIRTNFVDNSLVGYTTLPPLMPAPWAVNMNRAVIDLNGLANGAAIQSAINSAANQPGSVVHIAAGNHSVGSTITVPGNADIRIVGDGLATKLYWNGGGGSAMLKLATPSRARLSHLEGMGQNNAAPLIKVEAAVSTPARVLLRDCKWLRGVNADLYMADLPNAMVEQFGNAADYSPGIAWHLTGRGNMRVFGADGGQPHIAFVATNGVDLYVENHDTESDNADTFAFIGGTTVASFISGKMYLGAASQNGINVANFNGRLVYGISQPFDWINVNGSGVGDVWAVGNQQAAAMGGSLFTVNNSPVTMVESMNQYVNNAILKRGDKGVADASYVRRMIAHARSTYPVADAPAAMPSGQIDTIWDRVYLDGGNRNVEVGP